MRIYRFVLFLLLVVFSVMFVRGNSFAFSVDNYKEFPVVEENKGPYAKSKVIYLNDTGLTSLEGLEKCPNPEKVKLIFIKETQIKEIPSGVFSPFKNLEVLMVCNNKKLKVLPKDMCKGLTSLKQIDLGGNKLINIPGKLLRGLKALQSVSFEGNEITTVSRYLFKENRQLRLINFSYNQFLAFPEKLFTYIGKCRREYKCLPHLQMLLVYNNPLTRSRRNDFMDYHGLTREDLNLII